VARAATALVAPKRIWLARLAVVLLVGCIVAVVLRTWPSGASHLTFRGRDYIYSVTCRYSPPRSQLTVPQGFPATRGTEALHAITPIRTPAPSELYL
jgi:hypothetical protein